MPEFALNHPASYRDPSGFVFEKEGVLYRQVNTVFKEQYDYFIRSGCYRHFTENKLLIPHEQVNENLTGNADYYLTLLPERIPFISYPYEWSFAMLKDAALLTLQLAREALAFDMILKDATPYNIQWHRGRLIFIDTLSFEKFEEMPWIAYRQFCETFLSPLLLMHYSRQPLQPLLLAWPDGIPLQVTRSLLPKRSRFSFHTYLHIHLHSKISAKAKQGNSNPQPFSKQKLQHLLSSLEILTRKLVLPARQSTWSDYYEEAKQRKDYLQQKTAILSGWLDHTGAIKTVADLGANEGAFSKLAAAKGMEVIAADLDPYCINNLYTDIKKSGETRICPVITDLANPAPATGVNNKERAAFISRINVDMVLALALIHHLAIGKNIPFEKIADLFAQTGRFLVIEFVPKEDEKVKLMLAGKKDIYTNYTEENFILAFSRQFTVKQQQVAGDSGRTLFLLERKP